MKYTVTMEKEARVSASTSMAISKFKDICKAEKKIEKLQEELDMWVGQIPKKEMAAYVEITTEMSK